jgi:hypothetical protein
MTSFLRTSALLTLFSCEHHSPARALSSTRAVWHASPRADAPSKLVTAMTPDGGRRWRLTQPLLTRSGLDSQALAVDDSGQLHMVYRGQAHANILNEPGRIMQSVWQSGVWSAPVALSVRASDTGPMVGSASAGGLMAIWTEAERKGDQPELFAKSVASLWTPDCRHQ